MQWLDDKTKARANKYYQQPYPHNRRTRERGNSVGLTQQETERDPTTRRLETSDLTESADVPEVAVQEHRVTSPGAGLLDSNTIFPSPPQRKRKRCAEADPTQEKPLRKRR